MLVANSFDLWQQDAFFSAAEEVQQSADIMESAHRTWLKARKELLMPQYFDELCRQLQMALGTAKWQLEEFERAVNLSYRDSGDEITITRHNQFVSAIRDQISRVEADLKESFDAEGKKPFRWVNLDEEECDDLAHFLSGISQRSKDEETQLSAGLPSSPSNAYNVSGHSSSVNQTRDEDIISYETDRVTGNRRTYNALGNCVLEIIIDRDHLQERNTIVDVTPKEKVPKPFFWRSKANNHPQTKSVLSRIHFDTISWIHNHLRGAPRSHRQEIQQISSPSLPLHSTRFVLLLLLTIFLVVPFLLYAA